MNLMCQVQVPLVVLHGAALTHSQISSILRAIFSVHCICWISWVPVACEYYYSTLYGLLTLPSLRYPKGAMWRPWTCRFVSWRDKQFPDMQSFIMAICTQTWPSRFDIFVTLGRVILIIDHVYVRLNITSRANRILYVITVTVFPSSLPHASSIFLWQKLCSWLP